MVHPLQKGHWLYCQGKFPALRWFSPLPFREGFYMCKTTFNGESTTAWNLIFWVVSHLAFAMKLRDVELLTLSHIQNIHWYCNHLISYSRVLHSFTIHSLRNCEVKSSPWLSAPLKGSSSSGWPSKTPWWRRPGTHSESPNWASGKLLVGGLEHEFYIFPNSWDDDPIWLIMTNIFQGGRYTTNQELT